jgi:hypothetical protein
MLFAPSVVTQQSSFQFKWRLLRVSHSFWKASSPVVVPFKHWSPANSSVISNSASIPRTNISSWVVSQVSVLSSRANENLVTDWDLFFKHDNVKSPISSILLVTVRAERLTSLTHLYFSGNNSAIILMKHIFTNSPLVNGLPSCAISLATWKLARTTAKFSFTRDLNIFCWSKRDLCKLFDLSVLTWPWHMSYFSLWRAS